LVSLLLDPEDGSETFLRIVRLTELQGTQHRRTYSSYQKLQQLLSPSEPPLRLAKYKTKIYVQIGDLKKFASYSFGYGSLTKWLAER
jgi:hypothetical protein